MQTITNSPEAAKFNSEELFDAYTLKRIRFFAGALVNGSSLSEDSIDDVAQDMAAELLKAFKRFDPEKSQRNTFINRVLKKFMLYKQRQECVRQTRPSEVPLFFDQVNEFYQPVINEVGKGEMDEQDLREFRMDLPVILARMPSRLRRVCKVLMKFSGLEAADRLQVSKTTLYRAIGQIQEYFADAGYEKNVTNRWDTLASSADVVSEGK